MWAGRALRFFVLVTLGALPLPGQFTVTPETLDFGEVVIGQSADLVFTAASDSFTPQVRATSSNPSFTVSPRTTTLGAAPKTFTVTFTPNATGMFSGEISIRLTADEIEIGEVAVAGVGIEPPNDPPIAVDDSVETSEARLALIDLIANDSDPDGQIQPNSVQIVTAPADGTVFDNGDGTVSYLPNGADPEDDSFTYQIGDDAGAFSNVATVTVRRTALTELSFGRDDLVILPLDPDDPNSSTIRFDPLDNDAGTEGLHGPDRVGPVDRSALISGSTFTSMGGRGEVGAAGGGVPTGGRMLLSYTNQAGNTPGLDQFDYIAGTNGTQTFGATVFVRALPTSPEECRFDSENFLLQPGSPYNAKLRVVRGESPVANVGLIFVWQLDEVPALESAFGGVATTDANGRVSIPLPVPFQGGTIFAVGALNGRAFQCSQTVVLTAASVSSNGGSDGGRDPETVESLEFCFSSYEFFGGDTDLLVSCLDFFVGTHDATSLEVLWFWIFECFWTAAMDSLPISQDLLELARAYRDEVLKQSEEGRGWVRDYYRFSPEALRIALRRPELFARARDLLRRHHSSLKALSAGRSAVLTDEDLNSIDSLLAEFESQGSADLLDTVARLRQRLRNPEWLADFGVRVATQGEQPAARPELARNTSRATLRDFASSASLQRDTPSAVLQGLPLIFEPNQGQAGPSTRFLARAPGYRLLLGEREAVVQFEAGPGLLPALLSPTARAGSVSERESGSVLRLRLADAQQPQIAGLEPLPGRSHYFLGRDPKAWRTGVRHFAKVRYEAVYPGIDVVYYGKRSEVEYDFVVAPGADPSLIAFDIDGAEQIGLASNGDLVLRHPHGEMRLRKPVTYQQGEQGRTEIAARYIVDGNSVRFGLGSYDNSRPLVIDPVLSFGGYIGGGLMDTVMALALDPQGNIYVSGTTSSEDFAGGNPLGSATPGRDNIQAFVIKLDPTGAQVLYSTFFGGGSNEGVLGIAVDATGSAYVTGATTSADFPVVNGVQAQFGGGGALFGSDAFLLKLDAAGSAIVYSTYLGGEGDDGGRGIAVDANGNAYVAGVTTSDNFPLQAPLQDELAGGGLYGSDAFVAKMNAEGTQLLYSTTLGGAGDDAATGLVLDSLGSAYVTGVTYSDDFPVRNPFQEARGGGADAFVAKVNAVGSALVYSTYLGGASDDLATGIAVDNLRNVYLTGATGSAVDFPLRDAAQPEFGEPEGRGFDGFVTRLNAAGSAAIYSTFLGGSGLDMPLAIALGPDGRAHVAGGTSSLDFPTHDPLQLSSGGNGEGFVTVLAADGSEFVYSTYYGGLSSETIVAVAADAAGDTVFAGGSLSRDLLTAASLLQAGVVGAVRGFVARISQPDTPGAEVAAVSSASFRGPALAPNSIASVFGENLATDTSAATALPLPTALGGVSATVTDSTGTTISTSLFAVTPGQVNLLIPEATAVGPATITINTAGGQQLSTPLQIAVVAPGLYTADQSGSGVAAGLFLRSPGGGAPVQDFLFDPATLQAVPIDFGEDDQVFLLLFGTGMHGFNSRVSATIDGEPVPVLEPGPVKQGQFEGLDQINLGPLPVELRGRGPVVVRLAIDGRAVNPVIVSIR